MGTDHLELCKDLSIAENQWIEANIGAMQSLFSVAFFAFFATELFP